MSQAIMDLVEKSSLKEDPPQFDIGDTVDVHLKILEGNKERIQVFTGVVIARSGSGSREMFSVRRIVAGEGVERKFPCTALASKRWKSNAAVSSAAPSCTSSAIASARRSA